MLCMGGQGEVGYVNLNSRSGEELSFESPAFCNVWSFRLKVVIVMG